MKKILLFVVLMCTLNMVCWADDNEPVSEGDDVEMYDIDPIKEGESGNQHPRSPRRKPYVQINNYSLHIEGVYSTYQIQIVEEGNEDEVIYNTIVIGSGNDSITLPQILQGIYRIQLIIGDNGYYGYIYL